MATGKKKISYSTCLKTNFCLSEYAFFIHLTKWTWFMPTVKQLQAELAAAKAKVTRLKQ